MGNRAVIVWQDGEGKYNEDSIGVYLHWNGGRDSVEAFLAYCEMCGFFSPSECDYGIARLAQVVGNFFGGTGLSIGIGPIRTLDVDNGDNGLYVCRGWRIVGRKHFRGKEQSRYGFRKMVHAVNGEQPAGLKKEDADLDRLIGEYIEQHGDPLASC